MRFFLFFFLILILSCSKDKEELVDIDAFLKQGKEINYKTKNDLINKNVNQIQAFKIYDRAYYKNWPQKYQNSQNLVIPSNISIEKKVKSINGKFHNIVSINDKIISIDKNSRIVIYDSNLKKLNSIKIYNRKIYKNYDLKFEIAVDKNSLFIADNLGNIYSYDLKNLDKLWVSELGVPFKSSIKIYKNQIFIINSNSKIYSLNKKNGKLNWSFETASKVLKKNNSYQIAAHKDKLYFTNDNGEIYCLDLLNGKILWSLILEVGNFQDLPAVFQSSPILIDKTGIIFFSSNYGFMYAIDSLSGAIKWSKQLDTYNNIIATKNYLTTIINNRIVILEKKTGRILFNQNILSSYKKNKISNFKDFIIGKEKIYIFDLNGTMVSINLNDLSNREVAKVSKNFRSYVILKNSVLLLTQNSLIKY
jgi:outer membrane protein assembly factor BamB